MTTMMNRSYRELSRLETFEDRFEYLKTSSKIGEETFGASRYLNQYFYRTPEWRAFRKKVIMRDNGCDLGIEGREIPSGIQIVIHHINPITVEDVEERAESLMDLDNVICTTPLTHRAIHYGDISLVPTEPIERKPNDTCPWKA